MAPLVCLAPATQAGSPSGATVTAADRQAAQKDFAEGQRAFTLGDFPHAAESFEKAYQKAPHHAALWNAARSWQRAGEIAKAANLYARYLREAPPNAPDRNSATSALQKLSPKLARLEIHATDVESITVDGEPTEAMSVYVTPGAHVIEGKAGDRPVRQNQRVEAGSVVSVALVAPPPAVSASSAPPPAPPPAPKSHKLSPVVFFVGAGVTAVLAGVTTWSGMNTLSQKDTFDADRSQANLDEGHSRQTRTNILLGFTAGAAVFTTVAAIWLVDWKGKSSGDKTEVKAGLTGNQVVLGGRF
jgi:hypothetical protein